MSKTVSARVGLEIEEHTEGRVARISIDNQAKRNAISPLIASQLADAFISLSNDEALRAVVLSGAGDTVFSAGADVGVMRDLDADTARTFIEGLHAAIDAVRRCPVPVIGKLRGYCFGGALELAAGCDFRIGDESVVIGMPEVRVGIPSVIEAALLPRLVGWGKAREMLLLGATYDAKESLEMGILQKLVSAERLDHDVDQWVQQLLANGPNAVRSQKSLMSKWETLDLAQAISAGVDHFSQAFETDEPGTMLASALKPRQPPVG